jgi:hypothetical protein
MPTNLFHANIEKVGKWFKDYYMNRFSRSSGNGEAISLLLMYKSRYKIFCIGFYTEGGKFYLVFYIRNLLLVQNMTKIKYNNIPSYFLLRVN